MFQQVKQFVTTFRELENQEQSVSSEERARRERLRKVLSAPVETTQSQQALHRYVLAVASLYPQAGASFIASNFAYYQAGKGMSVMLCELPDGPPYYYFALDSEERAQAGTQAGIQADEKIINMQNGYLCVKTKAPYGKHTFSFPELTSWLLGNSKETSMLIVDISSFWKQESAAWIMDMADEIWFVIDSDIPRFARSIMTEEAPRVWNESGKKVRLMANKWDRMFAKDHLLKRIEGTLSFWDLNRKQKHIDLLVPPVPKQKIMNAHQKAKFLLEMHPEESGVFAQMAALLEE